jgi:hypothetical protein
MSLAQRTINQMGALARKIKRNAPDFEKFNRQTRVLSASKGAQKSILSAQRQTDPSFGLALLAQKIEVAKFLGRDVSLARVAGGSGFVLQATINNVGLAEIAALVAFADAPSGIHQVSDIQTVADNDGSLNNQYFLINSANNENQYYVWFNVGGNGLDPAISYRTGIPVNIYLNSSAPVVGAALALALSAANGGADFSASNNVSNGLVTVTYQSVGPANIPTDGTPALSAAAANAIYVVPASLNRGTGFSYSIATLGQNALSLAGKYFVLNDFAGSVAVWYNVGGSGAAPVGFHRTLEVIVSALASANTVASATAAALSADSQFAGVANGSQIVASNKSPGFPGAPGNGTSTFALSVLQVGSINMSNLLNLIPSDLMEVLSGELEGQFFTIASINNNVLLMEQDAPSETGESGITVRFEMRTTIPAILATESQQV